MSKILPILLIVWLAIGAIAASQRGYIKGSDATCAKTGTIAVTVISGPLNYVGANPKVGSKDCALPQPSK